MRFKISTSKTRRDRWGHFLSERSLPTQFTDDLEEAIELGKQSAKLHKKWDVSVYDLQGPALPEDADDEGNLPTYATWVVCSFDRGTIYYNDLYFNKTNNNNLIK